MVDIATPPPPIVISQVTPVTKLMTSNGYIVKGLRNQIRMKYSNLAYSHVCHEIFGRDRKVCEAA